HSVSLVYSDVRTGNFYYPVDMAVETYDLCRYEGKSKSIPLLYKLKRELLRSIDTRKARAVNNDFTKNYLLDNLQSVLNRTKQDVIVSFQPAASKDLLIDLKVTT
ncbi:glycosyltransferase family 4 protein, partial [Veillonella atypica]|nr:glycosyltransferase family 4 protein [Veillonella atypica]